MGFNFGLQDLDTCFPMKHRWLFSIQGVSADLISSQSANCLPPFKASRPSFQFKEMEIKHLTESVFYPIKPEWKPINLVLYDIKTNRNPVFEWIQQVYESQTATWRPIGDVNFMRQGILSMYSGCGDVIQEWRFDDCWPQAINWGELDMGESGVTTVDITLRYSRAYFVSQGASSSNSAASSNAATLG